MTTSGLHLLIDEPVPNVRRLTLNRLEKRNKKNLSRALEERDAPFGDYRGRQGASGS